MAMESLFSFKGQIRRLPYALWSFGAFFSQHLVTLLILAPDGVAPPSEPRFIEDWWFYIRPLRPLAMDSQSSGILLLLALAYSLMVAWLLAALTFRRAANANITEWIAAAAMAPIVQIPVILLLCIIPPRPPPDPSLIAEVFDPAVPRSSAAARGSVARLGIPDRAASRWSAAAQGSIIGLGLTVASVAVGALVFGAYGYGMFVVSPFVVGAVTAYFGNREQDIGGGRTVVLVAGSVALSGVALLGVALEGLVCVILAAPLGLSIAVLGGVLGRAIALHTRRPPRQTLSAVAMLPLVFAIESVMAATTSFESVETIEVRAPPEAVWRSIVDMGSIDEPPALPFRLGVAYPLRSQIVGEGVGALRRGEFSTGTALERVTEWIPNRKLAFMILEDVPGMRELSPYEHVHAPHVVGYFRTKEASFELSARPDGTTEIVERTSHELRLEPALYWLPMARYVVHANNARVLAHIRRRAEGH
jgi:uncharacterized membrane protein YhaH (DUF805 family)